MTYETYRMIFYGGAALALVCLAVAIILFFVLKIYNVIGDLTGSTARKSIEKMRYKNEASGEKTYKSSLVNKERGNLTDRIMQDGSIVKQGYNKNSAMNTTKIATQVLEDEAREAYTTLLEEQRANETTLLNENGYSDETTMLDNAYSAGETTMLDDMGGETTMLDNAYSAGETTQLDDYASGETTKLDEYTSGETIQLDNAGQQTFAIVYELMLIHSDERIA